MAGELKPTSQGVRGRRHRRVERIEDWSRSRYSVVPPRAAVDDRLTMAHMRVIVLIGRVNTQQGWCQLSQTATADLFGMHRKTINAALSDLVKWGYVERQSQAETGTSFCHYRVLIDEPEDEHDDNGGVPPTDGTPPQEGVPSTDGTPPQEGVPSTDGTGVTSGSYTGAAHRRHSHNRERARRSKITDPSPPNPPGGEGGGASDLLVDKGQMQTDHSPAKVEGWAKGWTAAGQAKVLALFDSPIAAHVATDFLSHVVGTLNPPMQVDPVAYVRQLGNRLQPFPAEVLARLAARLIETQHRDLPSTAKLVDQASGLQKLIDARAKQERIAGSYPNRARHVIRADAVQWQPWLDHLAANDQLAAASAARAAGAITVTHKFPQAAAELVAIGEAQL